MLNDAAHPVPVGGYISLYATGEGQTIPAGTDGALATGVYPKPVLPVTVTIGGIAVQPVYADGADGGPRADADCDTDSARSAAGRVCTGRIAGGKRFDCPRGDLGCGVGELKRASPHGSVSGEIQKSSRLHQFL